MNINKKIMIFCTVSLLAICIFLAGRGTKPDENGRTTPAAQEQDLAGGAVLSPASGAAVKETESGADEPGGEQDGPDGKTDQAGNGESGTDQTENAEKTAPGTAPETELPEGKKKAGGKEHKNKKSGETERPGAPRTKKERNVSSGKKTADQKATDRSRAAKTGDAGTTPGTQKPGGGSVADVTPEPAAPESTPAADQNECVLQVSCSAVLGHMNQLNESAKKVIPADGIILSGTYSFSEGDTAFDVLKKACAERNILVDYVFTPGFSTYYVKGIGQLYEFDCGDESGWMYMVNGKRPDYGCSQYKIKKHDNIVFYYTCER